MNNFKNILQQGISKTVVVKTNQGQIEQCSNEIKHG